MVEINYYYQLINNYEREREENVQKMRKLTKSAKMSEKRTKTQVCVYLIAVYIIIQIKWILYIHTYIDCTYVRDQRVVVLQLRVLNECSNSFGMWRGVLCRGLGCKWLCRGGGG